MVKEFNEKGREILTRFFDESKDRTLQHTNEEVSKILKESGYSLARYYQLRTKYLQNHPSIDSEITKFLAKIKPSAEKGDNAAVSSLYAKIMGFTEKQEANNEPTPTDINRIAIKVRDTLRKEWQENGGNCPICGRRNEGCQILETPKGNS